MKNIEKLYCGGKSGAVCPDGFTCIRGECVEDITPPPPEETLVSKDED